MRARAVALLVQLALLLWGGMARAAPPWVDRHLTNPSRTIALGGGLGLGTGPSNEPLKLGHTGAGANVEGSYSFSDGFEVGLRFGLRIDRDGRFANADYFARTLQTETYGTRDGIVTNPELRGTARILLLGPFELGAEARIFAPIEPRSREGFLLGVPMRLRLGPVRLDTGANVIVLLYVPAETTVSFPVHVWFQASPKFFVGPMGSIRIRSGELDGVAGLGFGVSLSSVFDIKTMFSVPMLRRGFDAFGGGVGIEYRFE